jgi:hypothetical protein
LAHSDICAIFAPQKKQERRKIMTTKEGTQRNMILHLLEYKRAMRECIQNGADSQEMKKITEQYGFKLATPI